jgi:hypothetical protein
VTRLSVFVTDSFPLAWFFFLFDATTFDGSYGMESAPAHTSIGKARRSVGESNDAATQFVY